MFGKYPHTFGEIRRILPKLPEAELEEILNELIGKKLVLEISPKYSDLLPHFIFIPPFAAIVNDITDLDKVSEDENIEEVKMNPQLVKFQDNLYKDLEDISQDLIETLITLDGSNQTTEMLIEVEKNVKKFTQLILNDIIEMISPLKFQTVIDARDVNKLVNSISQKVSESEEIVSNMFSQFRDIVKEMDSPTKSSQVEGFKAFIRKLGESIDKRTNELFLGKGSIPTEKIQLIQTSLNEMLTNFMTINKISMEKFWHINNYEKIKELISILFDKCTEELTIVVPNIEDFLPLEKFNLDYEEDLNLTQTVISSKTEKATLKKPKSSRPLISKKQKKEITEKFENTAKKVAELKGYELSHDIAELLSLISDINPESVVIESVQRWLNRLLVIRKLLDSNTQYLLLDSIENWKNDYFNVKKKEEQAEDKLISDDISSIEKTSKDTSEAIGLRVTIISSEPHNNKHAIAFMKKNNFEYMQLKKNKIIAILGDDYYLVFGIFQRIRNEPFYEIGAFFTTYKPLIELILPWIMKIREEGKPRRDIEINRGFNEIIENVNDYTGRKIAKRLKRLLDVVFEQDGISLNILELKLLISKLEKVYLPLDNEMKDYLIKELNKLNREFSGLELIFPPEFRTHISQEDVIDEIKKVVPLDQIELEPIDPEKINSLFEILIEKIDELKEVEIKEQLDKITEVTLKLQGYSKILDWKNSLGDVDDTLKEPFKEEIKKDLLNWKLGLIKRLTSPKEGSTEIHEDLPQKELILDTPSSILEEQYISPGLTQAQFPEEEISLIEDIAKIDPETEIKELFNKVQIELNELSGTEISKILQNIVNIILETEGYSMALKGIKNWVSKLRMIREPLENEIKEDFELDFLRWKEKYE